MHVEIKSQQIVITMPLTDPKPSASGKTLVIASSHGNQPTTCLHDGKPVIVGVNCYIRS